MDDLAHQCPRKRKQDQDDAKEPSRTDPNAVSPDSPSVVPNAPRQPWLAEADDNLWTSPTSPQVSSPLTLRAPKRPRIETHESALRAKRYPRRSPNKIAPSIRHGSDIEDIGIVSTAHPGPSSGSLLRPRAPVAPGVATPRISHIISTAADSPIKFNSPHIPPTQPLINRQTLKELELDIILRNPVIRHDLLFDPGLQFRPRRKRDMFEKYWLAVWEEVQNGCTCVTLDVYGKSYPTNCVCARHPTPPPIPIVSQISRENPHIYTLRLPSRIPALLTEFLEVMLFVIQPLSNTAVYTNPNAVKEQAQEHSAHAAYLRSIFDPALIEQELRHKVFDPSGLFSRIGETLKHHCAPMRDRAVEEMVRVAQQPGPEAFKAVRMCLELLELMKLDIANHQLTQLRPWLLRNTGIFEIKAFKIRFGNDASLHLTRQWLHSAHDTLSENSLIPHPSFPNGLKYTTMTKNQQIYLCCLKGIVDLIFDPSYLTASPESPVVDHSASSTPPESPICASTTTSTAASTPTTALSPMHIFTPMHISASIRNVITHALPSIPETLYLDKTRMALISADALDATALHMSLLLFRQLVLADVSETSGASVDHADMMQLKKEIRDIGGPALGVCFVAPESEAVEGGEEAPEQEPSETNKYKQRRDSKEAVVLQVASRASHIRRRRASGTVASSTSDDSSPVCAPDPATLALAQRWADANMKPGAPLGSLLHKRIRDAVFAEVIATAYPPPSTAPTVGAAGAIVFGTTGLSAVLAPSKNSTVTGKGGAAGMEALGEEIRRLGEKIARLALIHLNTHLPMYETEGFMGI